MWTYLQFVTSRRQLKVLSDSRYGSGSWALVGGPEPDFSFRNEETVT